MLTPNISSPAVFKPIEDLNYSEALGQLIFLEPSTQLPGIHTPAWPLPHRYFPTDPNAARSEILLPTVPDRLLRAAAHIAQAMHIQWEAGSFLKDRYESLKVGSLKHVATLLSDLEARHELLPESLELSQHPGQPSSQRFRYLTRQASNLEKRGIESDALEWLIAEREMQSQYMRIDKGQTEITRFKASMLRAAERIGMHDLELQPAFEELLALTALFCTKTNQNPSGFLARFPVGLADPSQPEIFERRARAVLRGYLAPLGTARGIELIPNIRVALDDAGLHGFVHSMNVREIVECAFPGITTGTGKYFWDPAVRPWMLEYTGKGKDSKLIKQAAAYVLAGDRYPGEPALAHYSEDFVSFDIPAMQNTAWGARVARAGVRKLMEISEGKIPNVIEVIRVGAKALGREDLIGFGDDQLPLTSIDSNLKWRGRVGKRYLDSVTVEVINRLRSTEPEMFSADRSKLIPEKVREFGAWSERFNQVAVDCLRGAQVTILEALSRIQPDLRGWTRYQIKDWEMGWTGKWQGPYGLYRFRAALAYTLWTEGCGALDVEEGSNLVYKCTKSEWQDWCTLQGKGIRLNDLMNSSGLSFPYKRFAGSNAKRAIQTLFGKNSTAEDLELPEIQISGSGRPRDYGESLFSQVAELKVPIAKMSRTAMREHHEAAITYLLEPTDNPFVLGHTILAHPEEVEIMEKIAASGNSLISPAYGASASETPLSEVIHDDTHRGKPVMQKFEFADWYGFVPCSLPFRTLQKLVGASSSGTSDKINAKLNDSELRVFMSVLAKQGIDSSSLTNHNRQSLRQGLEDIFCFCPSPCSLLREAIDAAISKDPKGRQYTRLHAIDELARLIIDGKVDCYG